MLSTVRRLRRYVQAHGARRTLDAILRHLRERVYLDERWIVCVKDLDSIVEPWDKGDLLVEDLTAVRMEELAEFNRTRGRPDLQRLFSRYVEWGFHCFLAYRGADLVGYYWWVDRDVPRTHTDLDRLKLGIELEPRDVYGSHFFMLEEHRGNGLAATFLFFVERSLRERGYERLWGFVGSTNRPARWVYSTRGYKPMWVLRLRKALFIQRTTREPS